MTGHAVYLRLSKAKAGGLDATTDSLESQRETVHAFMRAQGVDPAEAVEFVDIISARKVRSAKRPGWAEMMDHIERGAVTTVWARHVDRLYRHLSDLETLVDTVERYDLDVRTAWSGNVDLRTASGRTAARITGAVSQGEVEQMRERVNARLAANRAAGRPHGGMRPYGWNRDGSIREEDAALIRRACDMIISGESVSAVARMFEAEGATTDKGNAVSRANILHILRSPRLTGQTIHKGQPVGTGLYEPILDAETFAAVQTILTDPRRRTNGSVPMTGRNPGNLLTQIAMCGVCGSTMNATTTKDTKGYDPARGYRREGSGKVYKRYKCRNKCLSISRDLLDAQAVAAMVRFWMNTDLDDLAPSPASAAQMTQARADLGKIDTEREGILSLLAQGAMSADEAGKVLEGLNTRRQTALARVEKLAEQFTLATTLAPVMDGNRVDLGAVADLAAAFRAQPLERQRQQIARVWRPVLRHASEVGPQPFVVNGTEHIEAVSGTRKQERRTKWECLLNPNLSFDPVLEDLQEAMESVTAERTDRE